MNYTVVIPAGGTIPAAYADAIGSPCRALAPLGPERRPVLQQVIFALRDAGGIGKILVVAPDAVRDRITGVDVWLPDTGSGARNILAGLTEAAQSDDSRPVLVCPSDLPLLTTGAVAEFCRQVRPNVSCAIGLVGAEAYHALFPGAPPSQFVPLREAGPVTLGGVFCVKPSVLLRQSRLMESLFASRKSQWRMARLLGPRLLWEWATGTLSLGSAAARAEEILGEPVQVISDVSPTLAYDIDTLDDYTYAAHSLAQSDAAQALPE